VDGTIVPCAAGGSLMFTPELALPALQAMKARFGDRIYGRYFSFLSAQNKHFINDNLIQRFYEAFDKRDGIGPARSIESGLAKR
jgi:hypothetical protein